MKLSLKSTVNKPTPRVSRLTSPLKEYAASCHQEHRDYRQPRLDRHTGTLQPCSENRIKTWKTLEMTGTTVVVWGI